MKKNQGYHGAGAAQFDETVFPAEMEFIRGRRERINAAWQPAFSGAQERRAVSGGQQAASAAGMAAAFWKTITGWAAGLPARLRQAARSTPEICPRENTPGDICGIALSGGGIRSATFNLGVLQVLAREKLLWRADYLSTVSGGGYTGSCLSSLLNDSDPAVFGREFPFAHYPGVEESPAFKHLRLGGSYLAPRGIASAAKMPALLLCGILSNLLLVLPYALLFILAEWALSRGAIATAGRTLAESGLDFAALKALCSDFYRWTPWALGLFLAGVLIYPLARRSVCGCWRGRNRAEYFYAFLLMALAGVALAESFPAAILAVKYLNIKLRQLGVPEIIGGWKALVPVLSLPVLAQLAGGRGGGAGKILAALSGLAAAGLLFIFAGNVFLFGGGPAWLGEALSNIGRVWTPAFLAGAPGPLCAIPLLLIALAIYTLAADVNHTSLHSFYRDRLSKAYLFRRGPGGAPLHNDGQKLSSLYEHGCWAPYHLINAALNLQHSRTSRVEARRADYFVFSSLFTGSESTGYCPTKSMEEADAHLNLGTAMAVSGAAAAPNMGDAASRPLALLLTLLDIRLDYWLPNPARLNAGRPPRLGVGPAYLLREYLGRLDENSPYVNVSDGGHIENLGIYELLRRRCRYIIACDSEADPQLRFGGLAEVIRQARIDFGIEIDINLRDIRRDGKGISRRPYALGRIKYGGDAEEGWLLYIKSSLPADMDEYVREYWQRNPAFPHETTADQFFDEAQFEAYRALGYHIASALTKEFSPAADGGPDAVNEWFASLAGKLYHLPSGGEAGKPPQAESCAG